MAARRDHVIVFRDRKWYFHQCLICGKNIDFKSPAAKTGAGPECARRTTSADIARMREAALERDRRRYRSEVMDLGFKIE